jgi:hypothetical protein
MRQIMKAAVDHLFSFLVLKQRDQQAYEALIKLGERYTTVWDAPASAITQNRPLSISEARRKKSNLKHIVFADSDCRFIGTSKEHEVGLQRRLLTNNVGASVSRNNGTTGQYP